jgi:hypothetical protein
MKAPHVCWYHFPLTSVIINNEGIYTSPKKEFLPPESHKCLKTQAMTSSYRCAKTLTTKSQPKTRCNLSTDFALSTSASCTSKACHPSPITSLHQISCLLGPRGRAWPINPKHKNIRLLWFTNTAHTKSHRGPTLPWLRPRWADMAFQPPGVPSGQVSTSTKHSHLGESLGSPATALQTRGSPSLANSDFLPHPELLLQHWSPECPLGLWQPVGVQGFSCVFIPATQASAPIHCHEASAVCRTGQPLNKWIPCLLLSSC